MRTRRSGIGLFCQSTALTLALLVPMIAAAGFVVRQRQQQLVLQQAAAQDGGVPVEAGAQSVHRLLLAVQGEEPEFLLLRIDAPAAAITLCGVPGSVVVASPAGPTTLADCYRAAGPARAAQLLGAAAGAAPDRYFAATAATWAALLPQDRTAQLPAASLPAAAAAALDLAGQTAVPFTPAEVEPLLRTARAAAGALPALRAQLWAALLEADPAALPQLAAAAREQSAETLTDLSARDLHALEQTLAWLAERPGLSIGYDALPTRAAQGGEQLTPAALERARALLA